jgi:hypothetical protein
MMLEKTFINNTIARVDISRLAPEKRAQYRAEYLNAQRESTTNYIALMLNAKPSEVQISEGIDIWDYHQGRYEGEAEVGDRRIKFVSQNYYKNLREKYVHIALKDLDKVR